MKKIFLLLFTFFTTISINCMHPSLLNKKPKSEKSRIEKEINNLYNFEKLLPKKIVHQIKKMEKWPDWAKQTTGAVLSGGYVMSILFLASYL